MQMSKKLTLRKQINETKAKLDKLREQHAPRSSGLVVLIESELEKAELALAAKAMVKTLQDTAQRIAKMETDDVMPILDAMKSAFGPEVADKFNVVATDQIRAIRDAFKTANDQIGNEVLRMEKIANGEPATDMDMAPDLPAPEADLGADLGDDMASDDLGADDNADAGMDLGGDADLGMDDAVADEEPVDYNDSAAGRDRKESVNLDKRILESFRKKLREGVSATAACASISRKFGIDAQDVAAVILEAAKR